MMKRNFSQGDEGISLLSDVSPIMPFSVNDQEEDLEKVLEQKVRAQRSSSRLPLLLFLSLLLGMAIGGFPSLIFQYLNYSPRMAFKGVGVSNHSSIEGARCTPYTMRGYLATNDNISAENKWIPILPNDLPFPPIAPDFIQYPTPPNKCEPVDYMSLLSNGDYKNLNFARNKTIVLLGDSVDRGNIQHFCEFTGNKVEIIMGNNSISPTQDNRPFIDDKWSGQWLGRPRICTVKGLDLRIIFVFHFGVLDNVYDMLARDDAHVYFPLGIEARVDQVVKPLLASLALRSGLSSTIIPDVVSFTPGFWQSARRVMQDKLDMAVKIAEGVSPEKLALGVNGDMTFEDVEATSPRFHEVLQHIADAWKPDSSGWKTTILWRELHEPKEQWLIPVRRAQQLNQIGLRVVESLQELSNRRFKIPAKVSLLGFWKETDLGSRIVIDNWGSKMEGMGGKLSDEIHPAKLPGIWLYGNMLMDKLRMVVEARD